MNKKIIGLIMQSPLYILVAGSFVASIYASVKNISGVNYITPLIIGIIIILFIAGKYLWWLDE